MLLRGGKGRGFFIDAVRCLCVWGFLPLTRRCQFLTIMKNKSTVSVAVCGYAALGDAVGGDVIKSFVGVAPPWVVSLASAMVR